ncbi:MAG: hypothetical protein A2751_03590 [Candidatus Doudnabacteria bacterium RIFCSPHIGHO2_01_FULL_46_14]|uniref:Uncharacterized protein n=1 Tax=Candidatus Doudnabacteria bacterium RIFCSPHIGHO2_01_FULL_46_14 TaxID=1817824 RepID=A0A1F5NKZ1_9BACT|nr:MAG: hypothetical protein A2751_03590 [Candidatus Doudnabacteria bacterium RIFCSPHIGHO2_01_FULL_46_14]
MIMESEIGKVPQGETASPIEKLQREYAIKWLAAMIAASEERSLSKNDEGRHEAKQRWSGLQTQVKDATDKIRSLHGAEAEKIFTEAMTKYNLEGNPDPQIAAEAEKLYNEWGKTNG